MNKTWLFVAMSLLVQIAVRNAFGQEGSPLSLDPLGDPTHDVAVVMVAAPILGAIFGVLRLISTKAFQPVTCLGLHRDALHSDARR